MPVPSIMMALYRVRWKVGNWCTNRMGAIFGFSSTVRRRRRRSCRSRADPAPPSETRSSYRARRWPSRFPWTTAAPNSAWAISTTSTPPRLRRRATTPYPSTIASPSRGSATIPRRKFLTTGITTGRGRGAWWTRRRRRLTSARGARRRPCGASTGTRRSLGAATSPWTRRRLRVASTPAPPSRWRRRRRSIPSRRASSTAWRLDATRARRGCWTRSFTGQTPTWTDRSRTTDRRTDRSPP
mmetsp:Transcript_3199/g.13886  ORF Transcript_3199/g.13886 Transcript_3199/m.13886 type:complete len:241 (-) Transcript_3199:2442-3164(-)